MYADVFSLTNKVAIVTGGRRGIGKEIALVLAEAGANVAVCDYIDDDGQLMATVQALERLGRCSFAIKTDISHKPDVDNLVQSVLDKFGKIDILVNNAGIGAWGSLLNLSETEWDKVINTNLKGYYLCCQAVAKPMIEQKGGSIINIASVVGLNAYFGTRADILNVTPEACVYAISKAGVIMLTKRVAWELASFNIRVNAIAPGQILTELNSAWGNPEEERRRSKSIPLGRMGSVRDVANAAVFLASGASSYITAHVLVVDGGRLA